MEKILVTGGAGYVGSHVVAELVRSGYDVTVIDNLSSGHAWAVDPGAEFVAIDLLEIDELRNVFSKVNFDAVIHFAAKSLVGESMERPFDYFRHNIITTLNIVECAQQSNVRRIVFSSTANIFGAVGEKAINELDVISPGSPYGESKLAIERILHWAEKIHGIRYVSLRYFNAAGADPLGKIGEEHDPETHLIPLVLETALGKRKEITIFGDNYDTRDGTCIRDYVHVCDLASAHLLSLKHTNSSSLKCNLGTGTGHTVMEIISAAEKVTGLNIPIKIGPRRPGDPRMLVADPMLARRELGWETRHSDLETILTTAWKWHQSRV